MLVYTTTRESDSFRTLSRILDTYPPVTFSCAYWNPQSLEWYLQIKGTRKIVVYSKHSEFLVSYLLPQRIHGPLEVIKWLKSSMKGVAK